MMLLSDLFSFAYVPGWYSQLRRTGKAGIAGAVVFSESDVLNQESRYPDFRAIYSHSLS